MNLKKQSTPGKDYYRVLEADKFSQFDDEGLPTHDAAGAALKLNDNIKNGYKKKMAGQEKKYLKWLET